MGGEHTCYGCDRLVGTTHDTGCPFVLADPSKVIVTVADMTAPSPPELKRSEAEELTQRLRAAHEEMRELPVGGRGHLADLFAEAAAALTRRSEAGLTAEESVWAWWGMEALAREDELRPHEQRLRERLKLLIGASAEPRVRVRVDPREQTVRELEVTLEVVRRDMADALGLPDVITDMLTTATDALDQAIQALRAERFDTQWVYVITTGAPGPGVQALVEEAVERTAEDGKNDLLAAVREAVGRGCEFVEVEDDDGRGVGSSSGVEWEQVNGRWRLGPFTVPRAAAS